MPVSSRIVILGTGTHIGKTYASTQLAKALANLATTASVTALKPIESGTRHSANNPQETKKPHPSLDDPTAAADPQGQPDTSDAALLAAASMPNFETPTHAYAFSEPISPHLAARQTGVEIDLSRTIAWISGIEQARQPTLRQANTLQNTSPEQPVPMKRRSWLLIETAGGAFSPLGRARTNVTLAQLLEPAIWILVAPDRLGVLHDLTTTLHAMRTLSRMPDTILLSQCPPADRSTGKNASELDKLGIADTGAVIFAGRTIPDAFLSKLIEIADRRKL